MIEAMQTEGFKVGDVNAWEMTNSEFTISIRHCFNNFSELNIPQWLE